jgi:methionyl-tRNA formyltransferase
MINGERYTGISIHAISPGLDAGNILFQQAVEIGPADTVTDLYEKLNAVQRGQLAVAVARYLAGDAGVVQDEREATYCCSRTPEDGEIDWSAPTAAIRNLIRALTPPYPGAFTYLAGEPLRVWKAEPAAGARRYQGRVPGRVVSVSRKEGYVEVLTGDGVLRVFEVQIDGGPRQPAAAVISSVRSTLGLRLSDLMARVRQLEERLALAGQAV